MFPEFENRNQHVELIAEKASLSSMVRSGDGRRIVKVMQSIPGNKGIQIPRPDLGLER